MANVKITDLTAYTDAASTDVLPVVDVTNDVTKKISISNLLKAAPLGSAAAPGIAFDGDPNTGVYSPGADQVAISTNGSGRLFVDASGRVGIGSSSVGASYTTTLTGNGSSIVGGLQLSSSGNTAYVGAVSATSADFEIYNSANGYLRLATNNQERLRITSAGLVGIGTSAPFVQLTNVSSNGGLISSNSTGFAWQSTANDWAGAISSRPSSGNSYGFRCHTEGTTSSDYIFGASSGAGTGTFRFLITGAGNVGIGTTPGTKFHVESNGAGGDVWIKNGASQNALLEIAGNNNTLGSTSALYGQDASNNVYAGWARGSHPVLFGSGNSEAFRVDTSRRVLVGTSSASASSRLVLQGSSAGSGSPAIAHFSFDGATPANGDGLGFLIFGDNTQSQGAFIFAARDGGTWSGSSKPSRLAFSTTADGASSPTERVRIDSNGALGVVCASNTDSLYVSNAAGAGTTRFLIRGRHGATGVYGGTESFVVYTNGNVQNTNNSYGAYSDIKLKENIVDAGSQWDDLKALQVRNYNLKEGQTHRQIGLIAQEVELVSPGLVSESPDRDAEGNDLGTVTKSVNYSVLYMKAVKALQEAMERIETLEAKVAALEGA